MMNHINKNRSLNLPILAALRIESKIGGLVESHYSGVIN